MAPRPIPKVDDFVCFADLDPTNPDTVHSCIYHLSNENRRCRISADRKTAQRLRNQINQSQDISLDDLQQYALANCCNCHHRSKLADYGLLEPLARRWQTELRHARQVITSHRDPANRNGIVSDREPTQAASTTEIRATPLPRYNLRSGTVAAQSQPSDPVPSNDSTVSRFKPHETSPQHTVASKLLNPLTPRDSKSGILYLFNRPSSPGFVKIGLTTKSVQERFYGIQRDCEYRPRLIESFDNVPHIYRVEKLVHYELIRQWRTEKKCEGCSRQHVEWFETNISHAVNTARQWVEWMTVAEPYESNGLLKSFWRLKVRQLQTEGRPITAQTLLDVYRTLQNVMRDDTEVRNASAATRVAPESAEDIDSVTNNALSRHQPHIRAFAQAVLALPTDEQQAIIQVLELIRRSSRSVEPRISPASTFTFQPERLERRDTNISIISMA